VDWPDSFHLSFVICHSLFVVRRVELVEGDGLSARKCDELKYFADEQMQLGGGELKANDVKVRLIPISHFVHDDPPLKRTSFECADLIIYG
jgi:hypothetical protein